MKKILPNVHLLKLGSVNAYLIEHDQLSLIDTGFPGSEKKIFEYIHRIGRNPEEIQDIIITHLHTDHSGSAAEIKAATKAKLYMHTDDAELAAQGISFRDNMEVSPGMVNRLVYNLIVKKTPRRIKSFTADYTVQDGDEIPVAGGLKVVHAPGHSQGQIGLLTSTGEVFFAADTCANMMGLSVAPFYEDIQQGFSDLQRISSMNFEVAFFGHGNPLFTGAAAKFQKKFIGEELKLA